MELAQQCVSSLQGIAEVDRVAPSIRVRGRSATAVGTHDVDFVIARRKAQDAERLPSFHEQSLLPGSRRASRRSTSRLSDHTPDERHLVSRESRPRTTTSKACSCPLPRRVPSSPGDHGSANTGHEQCRWGRRTIDELHPENNALVGGAAVQAER